MTRQRHIERRFFMRRIIGGALACPVCAVAAGPAFAAAEGSPHWSYEGHEGPEHWGELTPDFKTCDVGVQQSPVDLVGPVPAKVGAVKPSFKKMPLEVLNNGHTVQVNCAPGSGSRIAGKQFDLLQFHFHHPSEHLLDGRSLAMECHFVHRSSDGQLAVLGVFIREGRANEMLAPIWRAMPRRKADAYKPGVTIDPAALLPEDRTYFRYHGSLTTPPCSEGVLWTVFAQPVEASSEQIQTFAAMFPNNARPVQTLNRRYLLENR